MKVLLRISYAVLMATLFIAIGRQAIINRYNKYYYNEGKIILESDIENKDLFFYEPKGIHKEEPLFTFTNDKVKIKFYEVTLIDHNVTDNLSTSLFTVIEPLTVDFNEKGLSYILNFKRNMPGEESVYPVVITNFLKLDYYLLDTGFGELLPIMTDDEEYDLIDKKINGFEIFSANNSGEIIEVFIEEDFEFNRNNFPIRNEIKSLFDEDNNISEEDRTYLKSIGINFQKIHNASKYNYILYIWYGIYFVVLFVSFYFIYIHDFSNSKLFRKKPTKALTDSIKKDKD